MKKGEKSLLICKADYAYGSQGSPPKIPGGATLHFEVRQLPQHFWVGPSATMSRGSCNCLSGLSLAASAQMSQGICFAAHRDAKAV